MGPGPMRKIIEHRGQGTWSWGHVLRGTMGLCWGLGQTMGARLGPRPWAGLWGQGQVPKIEFPLRP